MTRKIINPAYGAVGDDPSTIGLLQGLRMNVEALLKWAKFNEQKLAIHESAIINFENITAELIASLEAISRVMVENELTTKEQFDSYREEVLEAQAAYKKARFEAAEEELKKAADDSKSKIWVPNKKIVPVD